MDRPVDGLAGRIELASHAAFQLGNASIDPAAHEARFAGQTERLQPQTLKVLVVLAGRQGQVVSREELIDRCWDGRYVGDDVVNRSILLLRRFARQAGGFIIETIPKAGYRLMEDPAPKAMRRLWPNWALPAFLLAAMAAGIGYADHHQPALPVPPSIALKPFTSSDEPDARDLATASGEALSHMLLAGSYPPRLDWPSSPKALAGDDLILGGDVRQVGDDFVAVVQLTDRKTGTILFSRRFEAASKDVADLPERIGAELSSNVTGALAMLILDRRHPVRPEIAADLLKQIGMTVEGQDPLAAYAVSRRLVERDPQSALPQIGLAFDTGFALGALPRAQRAEAARNGRVAARRANMMVPDFGDTYVPWCLLHPQSMIAACETRMRQGLKADPDAPFVPTFLSSLLLNAGRHREALELARASLTDHPYQPHKLRRVINLLILLGLQEDADQTFAKARRWWPNHAGLYWDRLYGYALKGDLAGAERAVTDTPASVENFDRRNVGAIFTAWKRGDGTALKAACLSPGIRYTGQMLCIGALQKGGDRDTAFRVAEDMFPEIATGSAARDEQVWLDDPYAGPDPMLSAPVMKWLRSDPRYLSLVERMGLAAYWRSGPLPDFCALDHEPVCKAFVRKG